MPFPHIVDLEFQALPMKGLPTNQCVAFRHSNEVSLQYLLQFIFRQ